MMENGDARCLAGPNPYVGPRPFEVGETLFGRDAEIAELYYLICAERIVILHSPSGAGKSSLVQAGLIPRLRANFDVWRPTRLNQEPVVQGSCGDGLNRYTLSALAGLEEEIPAKLRRPVEMLAKQSLVEYAAGRPKRPSAPENAILIFDQFEEILTVDPLAEEAKRRFFDQLGELLRNPDFWALLVLREEYLAPLDKYARQIPTQLKNRFRIDLLGLDAAQVAMVKPAQAGGRKFPAVETLVHDLATTRVQQVDGSFVEATGLHVEPVHLQVVCRRLWDRMPADDLSIDTEDLEEFGGVTEALSTYYQDSIEEIVDNRIAREHSIRKWFGEHLITASGIRKQVLKGTKSSEGLANQIIEQLLDRFLIRAEQRAGATWYELVHDRFIDPIRESNRKWSRKLLRRRLVATSMVIALLWGTGWFYLGYERAQRHSQTLLKDALSLLETRPQQSLKKALEAVKLTYDVYRTVSIEAESTLHEALYAARGRLLWEARHADAIEALALSVDGRRLAAAGADGSMKVWEVESGALPTIFGENGVRTIGLAFNPDSKRLATVSLDNTARIWEISTSQELLAISGDQAFLNTARFDPHGTRLVTAGEDGTVKFWDALSGTYLHSLTNHSGAIFALSFKPDGSRLATADEEAEVRVWNVDSGALLSTVAGPTEGLKTVVFNRNGERLATAGLDDTLKVWEVETGEIYRTLPRFVLDAIFNKTGDSVVIATNEGTANENGTISIWDLESSRDSVILRDESGWEQAAFSPTGRRLATASEHLEDGEWSIKVWEYFLDYASSLFGHERSVLTVGFSPDGKSLATLSVDRTAKLWSLDSGGVAFNLSDHLGPIDAFAFSPDGTRLATAGEDWMISLWEIDTWHRLFRFSGHSGWVENVAFSPNGKLFATSSSDGTAKVWNARTGREICTFRGHKRGARVWAIAFNPEGGSLATATDIGQPKVWDALSCSERLSLDGHAKPVNALAFSPNGRRLATASDDSTVKIWHTASGLETLTLRKHTQGVRAVAFSPDGNRVVTGGMDRTVHLWDAASGHQLFNLPGNARAVYGLAFSPDGRRLAISGEDETVRVEFLEIEDLMRLAERRTNGPSRSETELQRPPA